MSIWQSIAMMSGAQIGLLAGLLILFAIRGPSLSAYVLTLNLLATLAVCAAMDFEALDRDHATLSMMLIDMACAAALIWQPGMPRVLAAVFAIMTLVYSLNILLGVQISTTFAIVNGLMFIQLAVAGIGGSGDDSGHRGRSDDVANPVLLPGRNHGLDQSAGMAGYSHLSQDRGG